MAAFRLAFLSVFLLAGSAWADEFSEFRIPEHRWRSLRGDAEFAAVRNHHDYGFGHSSNGYWNGLLRGTGLWALDSDDLQWLATVDALGSAGGDDREETTVLTNGVDSRRIRDENESDQVTERVSLNGEFRLYPGTVPIGLNVGGSVWGTFRQASTERIFDDEFRDSGGSTRNVGTTNSDIDNYDYQANVTAGVGVGRVRDATGVYLAYLLEQRLRADRLISESLSPEARARLASLFYIAPRYAEVHDLPAKFFWRDVEDLLREDGVLTGSLDAYALLHALEGYTPGTLSAALRQRGYWIAASATYNHLHSIIRQDVTARAENFDDGVLTSSSTFSSNFRGTQNRDNVLFGPEAEVRMPIGWRWQLDANGFARFNAKGPARRTSVGSSLFLRYLIAERWAATYRFHQTRDTGSEVSIAPGWRISNGVEIAYYLEDGIVAGLRISDNQEHYASSGTNFVRDQRVSLTLSYLFSGGLDAPGLIDPVRPLRGGTLNP